MEQRWAGARGPAPPTERGSAAAEEDKFLLSFFWAAFRFRSVRFGVTSEEVRPRAFDGFSDFLLHLRTSDVHKKKKTHRKKQNNHDETNNDITYAYIYMCICTHTHTHLIDPDVSSTARMVEDCNSAGFGLPVGLSPEPAR